MAIGLGWSTQTTRSLGFVYDYLFLVLLRTPILQARACMRLPIDTQRARRSSRAQGDGGGNQCVDAPWVVMSRERDRVAWKPPRR